jgi:hypothetical protein
MDIGKELPIVFGIKIPQTIKSAPISGGKPPLLTPDAKSSFLKSPPKVSESQERRKEENRCPKLQESFLPSRRFLFRETKADSNKLKVLAFL